MNRTGPISPSPPPGGDWIDRLIERRDFSLACEPVEEIPHLRRQRRDPVERYRCRLSEGGDSVEFYITMPDGAGAPAIDQILFFWAQQVQIYEACADVAAYATEFGLDPDGETARDQFDDMRHHAESARALLGDRDYYGLIAGLEAYQAMGSLSAALPDRD